MKYINSLLSFFILSIFVVNAQTPSELKSWLPPVEGWTVSDKIEIFTPENLFDRINGSAPLFIENNFREMTAMEYNKGDEYITIQAYRHATPEDAFGMYASERSSDLQTYPIGGEAQGDETNIYFFAGDMYVKIWSDSENAGEILRSIAKGFAQKIDVDAAYPAVVSVFPKEDKIPYSEAYITSNYIGHEFLKAVYTANYKKENNSFQAFVIDAKTPSTAKTILSKYFTFTKQSQDFQEEEMVIKDRYNGDIPVIWKGQYIMGIFSESGKIPADAGEFLKQLADSL